MLKLTGGRLSIYLSDSWSTFIIVVVMVIIIMI